MPFSAAFQIAFEGLRRHVERQRYPCNHQCFEQALSAGVEQGASITFETVKLEIFIYCVGNVGVSK